MALGAQSIERGVHMDRVPRSDETDHHAERAELVFLPLAVALAQFAALAVEDDPGELIPARAAVELDEDAPTVALVVDEPQQVERLHQPSELLGVARALLRDCTLRLGESVGIEESGSQRRTRSRGRSTSDQR